MKKNDWILILVVLCVAGACLWLYTRFGQETAGQVVVKVSGKEQKRYSLSENIQVKINQTNEFEIVDGEVRMLKADCPDQICVKHRPISKNKESIVCLPNEVVIEVVSHEEAELDTIAN